MVSILTKNIAQAIYESSCNKEGALLDVAIMDSATFLKKKNLLGKKEEILKALEDMINKEEGIIKARVTTKSQIEKELEKGIEDFIREKYKAKEVILELKTNKDVLGGIKIEIGDEIIDTTLSSKIHQLQDYLIKN
jgi:F-type H+-transporting ATPase subunit delta